MRASASVVVPYSLSLTRLRLLLGHRFSISDRSLRRARAARPGSAMAYTAAQSDTLRAFRRGYWTIHSTRTNEDGTVSVILKGRTEGVGLRLRVNTDGTYHADVPVRSHT